MLYIHAGCSVAFPAWGDEGEKVWHFCQDHSEILEKIHCQEEVWTDERGGWVTKTKKKKNPLHIVLHEAQIWSCDLKCLSILVTQPQTSCTTPRSGGKIVSTETLLETTSAWSRGLNCDSFWPRGSVSTLLIQSTSLIAGLRWTFLRLDSLNSTNKKAAVVSHTLFFSFCALLTVLISSFCFCHNPVYQERHDLDP